MWAAKLAWQRRRKIWNRKFDRRRVCHVCGGAISGVFWLALRRLDVVISVGGGVSLVAFVERRWLASLRLERLWKRGCKFWFEIGCSGAPYCVEMILKLRDLEMWRFIDLVNDERYSHWEIVWFAVSHWRREAESGYLGMSVPILPLSGVPSCGWVALASVGFRFPGFLLCMARWRRTFLIWSIWSDRCAWGKELYQVERRLGGLHVADLIQFRICLLTVPSTNLTTVLWILIALITVTERRRWTGHIDLLWKKNGQVARHHWGPHLETLRRNPK